MTNVAYEFEVYDSIRRVEESEWDSLRDAQSDPFMDRRFIEAVENSMGDQCRFRHIVVRDAQRRPMATACLSSFVIEGASLAEGVSGKILGLLQRAFPRINRSKLILCGLPVSAGQSHIRFAPDADRAAALRIVDAVACEFASAEQARLILFKEIDPDGCRELAPLVSLGYRRADSFPLNYAPCNFDNFDDYLSRITSKKRRKLLRSQEKFAKSGLRVVRRAGRDHVAELYTDDVHRLFEAVENRSEVQFGKLPAEFFRELCRQLPDNTVFTFVYRGDEVGGFSASLFSETTFHSLFVGLDYGVNSQCDLYFNLLYDVMDIALRRRPRTIVAGQTADAVKHTKLGCYQLPMSLYVKGGRWSMRLVLKLAFSWIFPAHPIEFPRETAQSDTDGGDTRLDELTVETHARP
ncbi:MAG TPA: GNAT family N-acetyltransferase [Planctomycetaceae bacterium]|jgi:predicted N-acyltransferase|nr:GNAT family N-acetyltransferase [Planctomycetaceae bacterium]